MSQKVETSRRRLSPDARKAHLLESAKRLLANEGLDGFSLEAVAREGAVAATLPRHYFGSSAKLLKAATADVLKSVEHLLIDRKQHLKLEARLIAYLDLLDQHPWAHRVWIQSADLHEDIGRLVRRARRRMAENIYRRPWSDLSEREQLDAQGRIGYVERVVTEWLLKRSTDRTVILDTLLHFLRQPQL